MVGDPNLGIISGWPVTQEALQEAAPVRYILYVADRFDCYVKRPAKHAEVARNGVIIVNPGRIRSAREMYPAMKPAGSMLSPAMSSSSNVPTFMSSGLEMMRKVEAGSDVYLSIGIWVNKSLGFRGAQIYFDDYNKDQPDLVVNAFAPVHDVALIARKIFPWAEFEYVEPISDGAGEVEAHVLRLELNRYAKEFLELEGFYAGELPPPEFPDPIRDEDEELSPSDFGYDEPDEDRDR